MTMTAIEFFRVTEETIDLLAEQHNVKDLEKYYQLTDFKIFKELNEMDGIEQTFMQIAFHGQNATMISNIVKFKDNYKKIKKILCGFNPKKTKDEFVGESRDEEVTKLLEAFQENGITWNANKSKKRPNAIMVRYANLLLDAAEYLGNFNAKQEVVDDLMRNYENQDVKHLVSYFRSKIKSGFSVALTCDFLKEFTTEFSNLPKPDIHIKDTLCVLKGLNENYYHTEKREYECIKHVQDLVAEINLVLKGENKKEITVYQLDRMIWLICSNKFFLDDSTSNSKEMYLSKIV